MNLKRRGISIGFIATLLAVLVTASTAWTKNESPIRKVFDKRGEGGALWGILAYDLSANAVVDELNSDKMFYPSSNMKLFTTWAALKLLGPEYRWRTRISFRPADLVDGVLHGPLVVTGSGDPTISLRFSSDLKPLADAVQQLKSLGIARIDGYILIDDRAFKGDRWAAGWMYDDLPWYYAAPVGAFSVEENLLQIVVEPGAEVGDPAKVSIMPEWPFITIDNTATTGESTDERILIFERVKVNNTVTVSGVIPAASKAVSEKVAVDDPGIFGGSILVHFLTTAGITVTYPVARISSDSPPVPFDSPAWMTVEIVSPPLAEVIDPMNKKSINFLADQIFMTLGLKETGVGTWATGAKALYSTLSDADIDPDGIIVADGSGLSRYALISPRQVVRLLKAAHFADFAEEFKASLPVGGLNGNLSWRYSGSPLSKRIWAKTGTATGQSAISGYMLSVNDRLYVFSIFSNNYISKAGPIRTIQDQLLEALAGH